MTEPTKSRTLVRAGAGTASTTAQVNPAQVVKRAEAAAGAATTSADQNLDRLIHGAAAATLIYGDTGSGKTTLLATYARWVWKRFHVPTRLVTTDPGGYSDDVLALIKLGIIEIWRAYTRDPLAELGLPSETLQRACQGFWPAEIDPASGECPAGVPLLSPSPEARFAIAFDGLSSMQDWSMVDMGQRSARGTLGGEGSNMKTIDSGEMKMGLGNRASVGFTQGKARDWVLSSLSIPNLVCPPVFTALEKKILDYESKLPLYGPQIAGQAKTGDVPAWFGATLGTCLARDAKGRPQWRLYLRDYCWPMSDPTPHKAKIRASATLAPVELLKLPEFLADEAEIDKPLTKFNLGYLFDMLEQVRRTTLDAAAADFPDAPGLKASTIGQGFVARRTLPGLAAAGLATPTGLKRAGAPPAVAVAAPPVLVMAEGAKALAGEIAKVILATPVASQATSPGTAPIAAAPAAGAIRRPPPAGIKPPTT